MLLLMYTKSKTAKKHNPFPDQQVLRDRLTHFYFEKDLSFRQIAALIGGVSYEAVRRCIHGGRLRPRTAYKIERFLRGMTSNAA